MSNDWIRDALDKMDEGVQQEPRQISFGASRTYEVRDYSPREDVETPYDVLATSLTWDQAREHVDKNTTPENAGDLVVAEERPPMFYTVAVALHDRQYGGPEEGGWYYDTYQPDVSEAAWLTHEAGGPWVYHDLKLAVAKSNWLTEQLKVVNKDRYGPNSVLSQGHYVGYAFEFYPTRQPREAPHYE